MILFIWLMPQFPVVEEFTDFVISVEGFIDVVTSLLPSIYGNFSCGD